MRHDLTILFIFVIIASVCIGFVVADIAQDRNAPADIIHGTSSKGVADLVKEPMRPSDPMEEKPEGDAK